MNPNIPDHGDSGEGCSYTRASTASISAQSGQGTDVADANHQHCARAINNFEDVLSERSEHNNNDPNDSDVDMEGSVNGNKDHSIALENASGLSTTTTRHSTRKRKLPPAGSDNQDASPRANRKGKQPLRGSDPQMLLEQSHLRSDALRAKEFAVDLALHAQRHSSLAKSTKTCYDHYQRLWVEWCNRKGYTDYLVTKSKFQVYMSENLAEDTDEEKDIHPIRIKRKKMEEARNSDTFNKNDYLPSVELVEAHVKALCDLYETQKAKDRVAMAGQDHPRTPGIKALLRRFRLRRGESAKSSHAETLTVGDGHDVDFLREVMRVSWIHTYQKSNNSSSKRRQHIGLRNRFSLCWCHFMMCRGENMRLARLSDVSAHIFRRNSQDGYHSLGIILTMLQGKTNREGKENYGVVVRNKEVEICPVSALAFYLLEMWMDPEDVPFDDPTWPGYYLMPGKNVDEELSPAAHYASTKQLFLAAGVISKKKTHAPRGAGSRHAQDDGADIAAIENHGGWGKGRLSTHYLSRISDDVPSKMAGCTLPGERLWIARNTLLPPVELQRMMFPCVEEFAKESGNYADWLQWTENLMMDKSMYYNRPVETRIDIPPKDVRRVRMLFLLTHLRKVILQDAVALMIHRDVPFRYEDHGVFQHPALRQDNPHFRKFKDDLSDKMRNARSPMEDSLIANAPAIHNEFRTVHSSVQRMDQTLLANTDVLQQLKKAVEGIVLQISNKAIADGLSVDRVYEFMEKVGENMARAARRERRYQPGQQQQQTPPEQSRRPEQQRPESQEQRDQSQPVANRSQTFEERLTELETQLASRYNQVPPMTLDDVDPTMLPRSVSLERHWEEWYKGVDGRPSLWILNKTFKSKWRKGRGNTLTKTFSFKKAIVTAVLKVILSEEENGGTVDEREARALNFLIAGLNSGTTLNQFYLLTQKKKNQPEDREDREDRTREQTREE